MKTIITRLAIAIIPICSLAAGSIFFFDVAGKVERYRAAAVSHAPPGPEILGNSYGEMMNNLFSTSGR